MSGTENIQETVSGVVKKITYKNEKNGYTVLLLELDGGDITVVGTMPFISEGDFINCTGKITVHPTYGEQLKAETVEKEIRKDAASVLRYLSSGSIKGVGPATAAAIVEKFGENALDIIEQKPERLAEIRGISMQKAMMINAEYQKQFGLRDIMLLLAGFGINPEEALRIYKKFGNNANDRIRQNPYILCSDGIDFSFERAEDIAISFNIDRNCDERLTAGIIYVLKRNLSNGHTCLPADKLCEVAANVLECGIETVEDICSRLKSGFELMSVRVNDREYIYLPEYYKAERYIAARILSISETVMSVPPIADLEIDRVENMLSIKFGDLQRCAVRSAVENGLLILTGGPGTGKTTTLNAIINILEHRDISVVLAAPTGRAAQRITELTGYEAKTIHRLLEVDWDENGRHIFTKNERNPIDCDAIIIDEMSMVDTLLFESLLRALRPGCRIIMVGDSNQLPSVGAGNILNDLIMSEKLPSVELKTVFRQAGESRIITTAHAIINGETPEFKNENDSDFFLLRRASSQDTLSTVIELVTERLPRAYGFSPTNDIQVLCPSRKMDLGTYNLNNLLQSYINPPSKQPSEMNYMGVYIRTGDKVMQVKNNYDIVWSRDNGEMGTGVFNGDIGTVELVDKRAGFLKVRYDDRVAEYTTDDLSQLELAYAITVHKSQGCEFNCVVIPLFDVPSQLRYRNLLYTAVTRAKKMLVIVGRDEIFVQMAANNRKTLRYTGLNEFLRCQE